MAEIAMSRNVIEAFISDPTNESTRDALISFVDQTVNQVNAEIENKIAQKKNDLEDSNNLKQILEDAVRFRLKHVKSVESNESVTIQVEIFYDEIVKLLPTADEVFDESKINELKEELGKHVCVTKPDGVDVNPNEDQIKTGIINDFLGLKNSNVNDCIPGPEEIKEIYSKKVSSLLTISMLCCNLSEVNDCVSNLINEYTKELSNALANNSDKDVQKSYGRINFLMGMQAVVEDLKKLATPDGYQSPMHKDVHDVSFFSSAASKSNKELGSQHSQVASNAEENKM